MRQGQRVAIISSDAYYKSLDGKDPTTYNFDEPAAIDFDYLHSHLRQLKRGEQIEVPNYDFVTHSRMAKTTSIGDVDVVIIEGILVLFHEALRCVARGARAEPPQWARCRRWGPCGSGLRPRWPVRH